jgi:hypothetical protein
MQSCPKSQWPAAHTAARQAPASTRHWPIPTQRTAPPLHTPCSTPASASTPIPQQFRTLLPVCPPHSSLPPLYGGAPQRACPRVHQLHRTPAPDQSASSTVLSSASVHQPHRTHAAPQQSTTELLTSPPTPPHARSPSPVHPRPTSPTTERRSCLLTLQRTTLRTNCDASQHAAQVCNFVQQPMVLLMKFQKPLP